MKFHRQKKLHRILWLWWLGIICLSILFWLVAPSQADDPQGLSSSVMYQVTYKDRSIKNLNEPPTTNKGILMVTRITRTDSSLPSTETVSTGNQSMEMLNPGRTQETQLHWNGQTWTPAVKLKSKPKPVPASPAAVPQRPAEQSVVADGGVPSQSHIIARPANAEEIRQKIQEIMELLSVSDRALRLAEQKMALAASTPGATQNAEQSLAEARRAHQEVVTSMIQLKMQLGLLQQQSPQNIAVAQAPAAVQQPNQQQPYDPNRPITPPPVLNSNVAASGYGWPGACGWPYFGGNVNIQTQEPNPDFDTGPRVIVREQE